MYNLSTSGDIHTCPVTTDEWIWEGDFIQISRVELQVWLADFAMVLLEKALPVQKADCRWSSRSGESRDNSRTKGQFCWGPTWTTENLAEGAAYFPVGIYHFFRHARANARVHEPRRSSFSMREYDFDNDNYYGQYLKRLWGPRIAKSCFMFELNDTFCLSLQFFNQWQELGGRYVFFLNSDGI